MVFWGFCLVCFFFFFLLWEFTWLRLLKLTVCDRDVGEYLTCLSFILQRTTANKTSGAPSYSRWSSSQPHQVICPCQKGYETQVDTCFLLKWICEGIWVLSTCISPTRSCWSLRLLQDILWQTVRCSCCSWRGWYSCDSFNAVVPLCGLSGVVIMAESPYPLHLVTWVRSVFDWLILFGNMWSSVLPCPALPPIFFAILKTTELWSR